MLSEPSDGLGMEARNGVVDAMNVYRTGARRVACTTWRAASVAKIASEVVSEITPLTMSGVKNGDVSPVALRKMAGKIARASPSASSPPPNVGQMLGEEVLFCVTT
jgi:hypothetical protein